MQFNSLVLVLAVALLVFSSGCTVKPETDSEQVAPDNSEVPAVASPTPKPSPTEQPTELETTPSPEPEESPIQEQAAIGPNDCTSTEECTAFCSSNQEACSQFCEVNPGNEICGKQPEQPPQGNELPCETDEECDVYCSQNPLECGSEEETLTGEVSLPFDPKYFSPGDWGLWPFCVHGGEHPEGHGGIDFELEKETKILAACDGDIEFIEEGEEGKGDGVMISCGNFVASYSGLVNLQIEMGDTVKKGDYIADPVKSENEYYIHFEINDFMAQKLRCPLPYIDSEFKAELDKMLSKARYQEKSSEPDLCNCDWLPYKETMTSGS